ncbi:Hydrolase, haloacid dehalogenase-like family [Alloactinosynnema sp. L-07]|uniref:HAD-IA family hydrolase n=1 Tax=Alloactinosynnema sp. L-07 TaxID=1653480 RepID=UPI00065EFBEE|nr:HAD-IA family hydrolase [Alloactinosynnema sp. L-07]CRK56589.1 Hydrolase, haloacid dehalogenase-like family [Alloactinosynnema sp. L-07]
MGAPALILDFGGPVLLTPFELVADQPGTPAYDLLHGRGPLATPDHPDPAWQDLQDGRITERAYWADRSREWHAAGGHEPDIRAMIAHLYEPPRRELIRQAARDLVCDARAAGHPVAILTNDLRAFHSQEWVDRIEIVGDVDVVVDGSVEGHLKPHPRLYELLSERLGVDFADMVFLDDQLTNIRGAQALGITSVWFDPAAPDGAFTEVRARLGLAEGEFDG